MSPIFSVLIFFLLSSLFGCQSRQDFDIIVYGGTSAGVMAAIAAERRGHRVAIVEPGIHLGGMTISGLGVTDSGRLDFIGGLAREFYQRIHSHYRNDIAWKYGPASQMDHLNKDLGMMMRFEPHVAEQVILEMLGETDVSLFLAERLNETTPLEIEKNHIKSLKTENGMTLTATVFVDASYTGDLMAASGVSYTVGREASDYYNEALAGVQPNKNIRNHRFIENVDPYIIPNDPTSGALPGIVPHPVEESGTGDQRVQAYNFRLCLTNVPDNKIDFQKPRDYEPDDYELLLRNFEAGDLRVPLTLTAIPNEKTDSNNNGAVSTDYIGYNYDYPEANDKQRHRISNAHKNFQMGLLWTLANHPRVPADIRATIGKWGLAKDEFIDNDNWPYALYIRESRRMVGRYVMTEHDCRRLTHVPDAVGIASYNMDSHNVQRYITEDGWVQNEGDIQVNPGGPYPISFQALLPKESEISNLMVPVCLSASHIAYGSIRMEPVFMILGHSTGIAASLAISSNVQIGHLEYEKLKRALLEDMQILEVSK